MKRSTIILFVFIAILLILPFATLKVWMAAHPEVIQEMTEISGNKDTINQVIQIKAGNIPDNFNGKVEIFTSDQAEKTQFENSSYCEIIPKGDTLQLILLTPEDATITGKENVLAKITLPKQTKLFFMNDVPRIKVNINNASIQEAYLYTNGEISVNNSRIGIIAIPDSLSIAAAKLVNNKLGILVMTLTQGRHTRLENNKIGVAKFSGSDNSLELVDNSIGTCSGMKSPEINNSNKIGVHN